MPNPAYPNNAPGTKIGGRPVGEGSETLDRFAYDEFGQPLAEIQHLNNSIHNPFGFTGYQHDEITGLDYAQARYYAPDAGRFTAKDIIPGINTMPESLNQFAYCLNNPLAYIDLTGESSGIPELGSYLDIGRVVHTAIEEQIKSEFSGVRTETYISWLTGPKPKGGNGRMDIIRNTSAGIEVYEIKPCRNPLSVGLGNAQITRYRSVLEQNGITTVPGTSINTRGIIDYPGHPDWEIYYYTAGNGLILYEVGRKAERDLTFQMNPELAKQFSFAAILAFIAAAIKGLSEGFNNAFGSFPFLIPDEFLRQFLDTPQPCEA